MKYATLCAALIGAALSGCASNPSTPSHESPAAVATAQLSPDTPLSPGTAEARVNGLSCPLCAESLSIVMRKLDGVESVRLDLDRGIVSMQLGKMPPTRDEVARAIERAGFSFVGFVEP